MPDPDENSAGRDGIDRLADGVAAWLAENGGQFSSQSRLIKELRAGGSKVNSNDLGPAIIRLERDGRLVPVVKGQSRGRNALRAGPQLHSSRLPQRGRANDRSISPLYLSGH